MSVSCSWVSCAMSLFAFAAGCGGSSSPTNAEAAASSGAADASSGSGGGGGGGGGGAGSGGASGWQTLPPLPGGPRQETAVVELNGKIYVIGGFDAQGEVVTDVIAYEPASGAWSTATPLPKPLHHANAAVVMGKIYVAGALRTSSFLSSGSVYELDPASSQWVEKTPMPAGTERGASAVGVLGSTIYVAGGLHGGANASAANFSAYDAATDAWTTLPDLPEPHDHLVGGVVDGLFYAIGGRNGGILKFSGDVNVFDPASSAWSARAPMPTPRGGAAVGVVGGRFFVVGGEGNQGSPSGVFPNNEAYDPAKDAWAILEPMKTPRHGTGAVGYDGKLYVPGGADKQSFSAVDTFEVYSPPPP